MLGVLVAITALYVFAAEAAKRWFYRHEEGRARVGS